MTANPLPPMSPLTPSPSPGGSPGPSRFRQIDPIRLMRQHMVWLIIAGVVGVTAGVGAYFALKKTSPKYASRAQLLVQGTPGNPWEFGTDSSVDDGDALAIYMQNQINRLKSEDLLRQAIARPQTQATRWFRQFDSVSDAAAALQQGQFRVTSLRGTSLIQVEMRAANRDDCQIVLEDVLSVYLAQLSLETNERISGLRDTFRRQYDRARAEIANYQQQISRFAREEGLTNAGGGDHEAIIEYEQYAELVAAIKLQLNAAQSRVQTLQARIDANDFEPGADEVQQIEQLPAVAERDQQIRRTEEALETARASYPENHRQVKGLRDRLRTLETLREQSFRESAQSYIEAQRDAAVSGVASLEAQLAEAERKLDEATQRKLDLSDRLARLAQYQESLETAKADESRAAEQLNSYLIYEDRPDSVPIQRQIAPTDPQLVFPKLTQLVPLSTMLVLGLVAGLLFLRELLDQRLKSPADVKSMTSGELLGSLPAASDDPSRDTRPERCVLERPEGLMAEAYRQVRNAIVSKMDRRGYRTLMFVSGQPGAGVSTVAHNVAASLAANGRRVLLIDVNFRRPRLHRVFDLDGEVGLLQVLRGKADAADAIRPCGDASLSLLPAGRLGADATPELLERAAFRSLLSRLETDYDNVVIDAPPALITSESQLLAKQVDAVAVVAKASKDHRGMVDRVLRELDGQRADVIGVVLNGVRASAGGYYRRAYEAFYSYRDAADDAPPRNGNGHRGRRAAIDPALDRDAARDADDLARARDDAESR